MRLHSSGCRPSLFPPLCLLQAVLHTKCLIFSGSFYIWGFLGPPVAAATIREGAYYAGHRNGSEWVKIGAVPSWFLHPWSFLFFMFLPRESQTLFLPGEKKSVQGIHRLESLRSKSYLISLLTRLQGCDWHEARVAEAFECTAGRPSSIKTNQWLIQSRSRLCWDERGRGKGTEEEKKREMCVWVSATCDSLLVPAQNTQGLRKGRVLWGTGRS